MSKRAFRYLTIAAGAAMLSACASPSSYIRTDRAISTHSGCEDIRIEFAVTEKNRKRAEQVLAESRESWARKLMFWEIYRASKVVENAEFRKRELAIMYKEKGC